MYVSLNQLFKRVVPKLTNRNSLFAYYSCLVFILFGVCGDI